MPTISEILSNAVEHVRAGRFQEAEDVCRRVLSWEPNHPDAVSIQKQISQGLYELGGRLQTQGALKDAVNCYRRVVQLNPSHADAFNDLGTVFQAQGMLEEAADCYRQALDVDPQHVEAHNNLGTVFQDQDKLAEGIACFRRALEVNAGFAQGHYNLGTVFQRQGRFAEALGCYRRAIQLDPYYVDAISNLGTVSQIQGKSEEAVRCFLRALNLNPHYVDALSNLGKVFHSQGRFDEAAEYFQRALALKPDHVDARGNQALLLLLKGDFENGWREYEWRWKTDQLTDRNFSEPLWDGNPLEERTILLHAEQGFGDTFQFVRYAAVVKQQNPAATVVLECQRPLAKLLTSRPSVDRLIARDDPTPAFDVQVPLASLPRILKTTLETIPANVPYLFADEGLVAKWKQRLSGVRGDRDQVWSRLIGINWQGRSGAGEYRKRDIPLSYFAELAGIPGVRLISLQKDPHPGPLPKGEGEEEREWIWEPGENLDTTAGAFMDTAAIMKNLDLVITSDTSVPHLAGALGVPVWVALPFVPDWRWLLDRSDSPWYPTMRLFRQKEPGDWAGAFEEIQAALRERIGTVRSG